MQNRFITVPETKLPNGLIVPEFRVGQYLCSQSPDGTAIVTEELAPWVSINYHDARKACEATGFKLLTETQALAIAHNIASQACNWNTGVVGRGRLFQGLRNESVERAQPGTFTPEDPDEERWLTLSNGERICDANGNAFSWVEDDVQGDKQGIVAKRFAEDSLSLQAPFPSMQKGMGWRPEGRPDWSGSALLRGGCWDSGRYAGAFRLSHDWPDLAVGYVGFRCTQPNGL